MQSQSRLLEDLARVASSAMGVASNMRGEIEQRLKEQFETVLSRMDLVSREEFEAVREMAQKAREEQEVLSERLAALEAAQEAKRSKAPRKRTPAEPAPASADTIQIAADDSAPGGKSTA